MTTQAQDADDRTYPQVTSVKADKQTAQPFPDPRKTPSQPVQDLTTMDDDHLSQWTLRKRPWRLNTTEFSQLLKARYHGSGTTEDPFIMTWLDNDPENPKQYSLLHKCLLTTLLSFMALCVALASSAYTGARSEIQADFPCSTEVFLLGLSAMVLGYAVGPLLWGPLSEAYGRRNSLLISLVLYTLWTAVTIAAQNIQTFIVFRFFAGATGASVFSVTSGQLADMFEAKQRGVAMAIFSATPFMGPVLGPSIGGFLSSAAGWRWLMALLAIYAGLLTFICAVMMPETYAPVLLRQRASRLSQVTGQVYKTAMDLRQPLTFQSLARKALILPWALLFREPIVLILTVYMAVIYGTLYLCFAAFPIVFQEMRGWNPGVGGLAFMGVLVGILLGVAIIVYDNKRYSRLHEQTGGFVPPEERLPTVILGGVFAVGGLAWFAATVGPSVPWPAPVTAGIPFGIGFILIFMSCINYLVDSYVLYAASVMAANSVLRAGFAAVFPLFTTYMYQNLGVNWATAVPGFIALACFPFPILFYKFGERIRRKCKYSAEAARLLDAMKSNMERQRTREKQDEAVGGDVAAEAKEEKEETV